LVLCVPPERFDGRVLVLAGSRVLVSRAGLDGCSVETCSGD